ncbi:MAG: CHAT domain-containing protein [Drouetiella hepatica Uher 2000/2452]|jgi:CHAT domain-containing protein|uniref:CHAT domain-containing protein n=1 Tax=Drouetiella hepatica Uher 2000/2452 TaxID=904376 RepID=A0A951UQ03_9CYAN|nr:CHAT domain-containing protein [Drouetiella hepatica Uher 2000/2452]
MKLKRFFLTLCVALFLFVGCRPATDALFSGSASPPLRRQPEAAALASPVALATPTAPVSASSEDQQCNVVIQKAIEQFDSKQFKQEVGGNGAALAEFAQRQQAEQLLNFLGQEAEENSKAEYHQDSLCLSLKRLELAQQLGDRQLLLALYGVGNGYRAIGDFANALSNFTGYLKRARALGNQRHEAVALGSIGEIYQELGDYEQALQYHQQRLGIAYEVQHFENDPDQDANGFDGYTGSQLVGDALGSIGDNYYIQQNGTKAIQYYEARFKIINKLNKKLKVATTKSGVDMSLQPSWIATLTSLAKAYDGNKETEKAGKEYEEVKRLIDKYPVLAHSAAASRFYESWINFLLSQKRLKEALKIADGFIQRYQKLVHPSKQLDLITRLLAFDKSKDYCDKVARNPSSICEDEKTIVKDSINLIIEFKSGKKWLSELSEQLDKLSDTAKSELDKACERKQLDCTLRVKFPNNDRSLGRVYNLAGLVYLQQGMLPEAEEKFKAAIDLRNKLSKQRLSDTLKVFFFDTQRNAYLNLQQTLIQQGKNEEALVISEDGRAQVFAEMLGANRAANPTANADSNSNRCSGKVAIEQIRCVAQEHKLTLVEYSLIEQPIVADRPAEVLIWVVKPTGEIEFRSQSISEALQAYSAQTATNWIHEARKQIGLYGSDGKNQRATFLKDGRTANKAATAPDVPFDSKAQADTLQNLHALLIEPIADLLPTSPDEHVLLVPDGSLFLIPFAALQDKTGKSLLESHILQTAPSIQVLNQIYSRLPSRDRLFSNPLIVGNPQSPSINCQGGDIVLPPLYGAESEAENVAKLLHAQPLIRDQATESTVRQKINSASLIHLAAHGLLDNCPGYAVPGAIALTADGDTESANGWFTSSEIADLKLTANLAVLSSCSTGQGRLTGDGVMGLSRSFLKTVPSVILSLWSVDDGSTAELMNQFYEKLRGMDSPDKAVALRDAMVATKANYKDPRQWAAFSLMGTAE